MAVDKIIAVRGVWGYDLGTPFFTLLLNEWP